MRNQTTWTNLLWLAVILLLSLGGSITGWATGNWGLGILAGLMVLVLGYALVYSLKKGIRPRTAFERFEDYVLFRCILSFFGGGVGLYLLTRWAAHPLVLLVYLFIWLGMSAYFAHKIRGRFEGINAYKRRVGYTED